MTTQTPNHFIYISPSEMERFISEPREEGE